MIIKNSYFNSLIYIEGPTEGNVINPPIITFTPVDKYGNLFNDIFSGKIQNRRNLNEKNVFKNKYKSKKEFLVSLTSVIFSNNNATIEANNYIEGNKYIKIQYKSFKTGNVKLTSPYFKEEFNYRIKSGPIDLNNSYIEIINTEIIKIGDELKYIIHLKDLYGNDIDDLNEEVYIKLFENNSEKIKSECKLNNDGKNDELKYNILQCSEIVNEKNYEDIKKFFENNIIKCINCDKVTFKNYEKYISTTIVENNKKKETEKTEEKKEKEKKEKEEKMEKEEEKDEEKYEEKEKNQFENKEKDEQDKKSEEKEDEIKYEEEEKYEEEKYEEEKYEQEKEEEKNEQEKEEEIKYEEEKKEEENQENKEEEIKNEEEKEEEKIEEEKQEEKIQQEKEEEEKQEENQENIEEEIKNEEEKQEEKYEQEKEEENQEKIEEEKENEIKIEEEKIKLEKETEEEEISKENLEEKENEILEEEEEEKIFEEYTKQKGNQILEDEKEIFEEKEEEENPLLAVCKVNTTHPFWCLVNNIYTCTKSKTDCDCPEGYMKCNNPNLQNYCVPKNRTDMCPVFKNQQSICRMKGMVQFDDGVCRNANARLPNQRVCPGAKVLCADLTCRNNYDECIITQERIKKQQRCVGQQLESHAIDCFATITCSDENHVVCPDLTCVENEIFCGDLKECPEDLPYRWVSKIPYTINKIFHTCKKTNNTYYIVNHTQYN